MVELAVISANEKEAFVDIYSSTEFSEGFNFQF